MAVQSEVPRGFIAGVEAQRSHIDFIEKANPEAIMLKVTHARRLLKREPPITAEDLAPHSTVITTSTVNDDELSRLTTTHEVEIVSEFAPDFHIPSDVEAYRGQPAADRAEAINHLISGTREVAKNLADRGCGTRCLPLVKGLYHRERVPSYALAEELGCGTVCFYATQYFTNGLKIHQLVSDLEKISEEAPSLDILVIGAGGRSLGKLPPAVRAASSQNQWRSRITTDTPVEKAQDILSELEQAAKTNLSG